MGCTTYLETLGLWFVLFGYTTPWPDMILVLTRWQQDELPLELHISIIIWHLLVSVNIWVMLGLHEQFMFSIVQVDDEFKEYEKKFNFKIVKVVKSTSKTRLNHLLLSITFNDKYWRSQLDVLYTSIQHNNKGHHEKKSNLNNALLLLLGLWPKYNWF